MGVPAFFRWLSQKYLNIITDAVEEKRFDNEGNPIPVDTSAKNPNNFEVDNLYLDMNGIIHPCTHPEDRPPPKDEDEMMQNVYEAVDRLFLIARPRKILYLAVDGVAPRAKMNQQRSRRFRTVQEAKEKAELERKQREELIAKGENVAPEKKGNGFDSNCISPGTEFMHKVARTLAKYAVERLSSDPGFRNVKVIVSDASAPGEGEHKLMQFIRQQRAQPDYDPNTRHVISGLDADLIMLALATHEPNFAVLREVVTFDKKTCRVCGKEGHFADNCPRSQPGYVAEEEEEKEYGPPKPYQFLHINVLREYIDLEFKEMILPFPYDIERVIDDIVFMCFFVGNDFLPHMPSLEIREGAIDLLMQIYKKILPAMGGYLTNNGEVIMERTKILVTELGVLEDSIFVRRRQKELRMQANQKRDKERRDREQQERERRKVLSHSGGAEAQGIDVRPVRRSGDGDANRNAAQQLKQSILTGKRHHEDQDGTPPHKRPRSDPNTPTTPSTPTTPTTPSTPSTPTTPTTPPAPVKEEPEDSVQLGVPGWRERYYKDKFGGDCNDRNFLREVCGAYIEGLAWVLRYYYQGCCSWKWYYPYHYAPFACDIAEFLGDYKPEFSLGTPFKPFEQLMGVLPAGSSKCVPKPYRYLMGVHEDDEDAGLKSPILHFYPEKFKLDMNGKKMVWQAVALLPFIDEKQLLGAVKGVEKKLTTAEKHRNTHGEEMVFINTSHPLAPIFAAAQQLPEGKSLDLTLDKGDLAGYAKKYGPLELAHFGDIINLKENVVGIVFSNPKFLEGFAHESKILPGYKPLPKVLEYYGGEYAGGAGGLGAREGGYHHGQNAAANRMINHALASNQAKAPFNMHGPGGGPRFVPSTDSSGLPNMQHGMMAPPLFPAGAQPQQHLVNPYQYPNNNFNNGPYNMPPQFNNGPNQYNNQYNQYPNNYNGPQYNNGPNQYNNNNGRFNNGPGRYNNGPNQYGGGPGQYNNGPNNINYVNQRGNAPGRGGYNNNRR